MLYDVATVGAVLQRHSMIAVMTQPDGFCITCNGRHRRPRQQESNYGRRGGIGNGGHCCISVATHDGGTANGFHLKAMKR